MKLLSKATIAMLSFATLGLMNVAQANTESTAVPKWASDNAWYVVGIEGTKALDTININVEPDATAGEMLNESNVLQKGTFTPFLIDEERKLFGYTKTFNGESVIVVFNEGDMDYEIDIKDMKGWKYKDVLNDRSYVKDMRDKDITFRINEKSAAVLHNTSNDS